MNSTYALPAIFYGDPLRALMLAEHIDASRQNRYVTASSAEPAVQAAPVTSEIRTTAIVRTASSRPILRLKKTAKTLVTAIKRALTILRARPAASDHEPLSNVTECRIMETSKLHVDARTQGSSARTVDAFCDHLMPEVA